MNREDSAPGRNTGLGRLCRSLLAVLSVWHCAENMPALNPERRKEHGHPGAARINFKRQSSDTPGVMKRAVLD